MKKSPKLNYIQPKHRKGYDACYKIDDYKIRNIGWKPRFMFEKSILDIINHSINNPHWIS